MEAEKRKRSGNDIVKVLSKKAREEGGEKKDADAGPPSPREEEVEEFFAILRRMREAMTALSKSSNGDAPRFGERWTMEIDADVVGSVNGVKKAETATKEGLFDLNVVPEPETASR